MGGIVHKQTEKLQKYAEIVKEREILDRVEDEELGGQGDKREGERWRSGSTTNFVYKPIYLYFIHAFESPHAFQDDSP